MKWARPKRRSIRGLGDAVEILAAPIASGIDAIFKTDLKNCSSCGQRKQKLNEMFPFETNEETENHTLDK